MSVQCPMVCQHLSCPVFLKKLVIFKVFNVTLKNGNCETGGWHLSGCVHLWQLCRNPAKIITSDTQKCLSSVSNDNDRKWLHVGLFHTSTDLYTNPVALELLL